MPTTVGLTVSAQVSYDRMSLKQLKELARERAPELSKSFSLLSWSANPKTNKSAKVGDLVAIMNLWPFEDADGRNVCPWATPGCIAGCLNKAGNPIYMPAKERSRRAKTALWWADRKLFLELLRRELTSHVKRADRLGMLACARLNGTSDIPFEHTGIMQGFDFGAIRFYDYTKSFDRAMKQPYHLTLSRTEENDDECLLALKEGVNVAVVAAGYGCSAHPKPIPAFTEYYGKPIKIVDGDVHDSTWRHQPGQIILLRAKGLAKDDDTGFVVERDHFEAFLGYKQITPQEVPHVLDRE